MFVSLKFLLFVGIIFVAYWWIVPPKWRVYFLTAASFGYFVIMFPREMIFLLVLALAVYLWGMALRQDSGKLKSIILIVGIGLLVLDLGFFKYAGLVLSTAKDLLSLVGKDTVYRLPEFFVPLGISYFTFKMISYLIEIKRGNIPRHHIADFLNYIFFFPILISGPIERFSPFYEQSKQVQSFIPDYLYDGLPRILWGLFKKVVLADSLAIVAVNLQQQNLSPEAYWIAALAYTFQIYFDFSGYSDMAIGISRILGYRIQENFASPYLSNDLSDFWKRWHMSLTGWFRDYLFIPLGGSRVPFYRIIINTWIVMAVTGLWHGAAWHFVLWGMYHALGLTILRLYRRYILPRLPDISQVGMVKILNVIGTFMFVNIGWIWFACDTRQAWSVITRMFGM